MIHFPPPPLVVISLCRSLRAHCLGDVWRNFCEFRYLKKVVAQVFAIACTQHICRRQHPTSVSAVRRLKSDLNGTLAHGSLRGGRQRGSAIKQGVRQQLGDRQLPHELDDNVLRRCTQRLEERTAHAAFRFKPGSCE